MPSFLARIISMCTDISWKSFIYNNLVAMAGTAVCNYSELNGWLRRGPGNQCVFMNSHVHHYMKITQTATSSQEAPCELQASNHNIFSHCCTLLLLVCTTFFIVWFKEKIYIFVRIFRMSFSETELFGKNILCNELVLSKHLIIFFITVLFFLRYRSCRLFRQNMKKARKNSISSRRAKLAKQQERSSTLFPLVKRSSWMVSLNWYQAKFWWRMIVLKTLSGEQLLHIFPYQKKPLFWHAWLYFYLSFFN